MNNLEQEFQEQKIRFAKEQADLLARQEKEYYELVNKFKKEKPDFEIWEPKEGQDAYYFYGTYSDKIQKDFYSSASNCKRQKFRTEEQAELFRKRVLVYEILQKVAIELNGDWEPKENYCQYFITLNMEIDLLCYGKNSPLVNIYFESEEKAEFALSYLKSELKKRGIEL